MVSLSAVRYDIVVSIGPIVRAIKAKDMLGLRPVNRIYSHRAQDGWT